jgi:hypothetical protein
VALFNEILAGRFNGILTKSLGMKDSAPAPSLSTDIQAMIALEVDRPEWHFLGGTRPFGMNQVLAAGGVGNRSEIQCFNPAGSGMLVVVTRVKITAAAAGFTSAGVRISPTQLGTLVNNRSPFLDSRLLVTTSAAMQAATQLRTKNNAGITADATATWLMNVAIQGDSQTPDDWFQVLAPGSGVIAEPGADNVGITACFLGYERALEPSEIR